MAKRYLIFDLDGTLIKSMNDSLKIVFDYLKNVPDTDLDYAKYVFTQTMGKPLKRQLEIIYPDKSEDEINKLTHDLYEELSKLQSDFYPGVPGMINRLSEKYDLFLTTGNSTQTARNHLKRWGILDKFAVVLGSDNLLKWPEHMEYFKNFSQDENFFKKAIYIWDGNSDREIAKMYEVTFVHIWNDGKDKYEIPVVTELEKNLSLIEFNEKIN